MQAMMAMSDDPYFSLQTSKSAIKTTSFMAATGDKGSTPNPVNRPLLHERTIQALLGGERSNVQIVGSNGTLHAVIILLQRLFAR